MDYTKLVPGMQWTKEVYKSLQDADLFAPAIGPCLRLVKAEQELRDDYEDCWLEGGLWTDNLMRMRVFIDKWYPRRQELKDCGDCPNCLAKAAADEMQQRSKAARVVAGDWQVTDVEKGAKARYQYRRDSNLREVFGK